MKNAIVAGIYTIRFTLEMMKWCHEKQWYNNEKSNFIICCTLLLASVCE
jgi:hypothetical protein